MHPDTGEKILFNSPQFLKFVVGLTEEESTSLLHKLWAHSVEYTISHEWSEGDLVVWDERSTTHRAPTDVYKNHVERQLYRTTLLGQPFHGLNGFTSAIVQGEPMPVLYLGRAAVGSVSLCECPRVALGYSSRARVGSMDHPLLLESRKSFVGSGLT